MSVYIEKFESKICFPPVAPIAVIRHMRIRPVGKQFAEENISSAILDTGADFSTLPEVQYKHLASDPLIPKSQCEIRTAQGTLVSATRVKLQYLIPNVMRTWGVVYFLLWGEEVLVGRDILSKFVVQFDGPKSELRLSK